VGPGGDAHMGRIKELIKVQIFAFASGGTPFVPLSGSERGSPRALATGTGVPKVPFFCQGGWGSPDRARLPLGTIAVNL